MNALAEAAARFLSHQRIAVAGVSRKGDTAANIVYKKLRGAGYAVFAVNPNAETVEGDPAYASLEAIPDGVEAVVIATHPDQTAAMVEQCIAAGVKHVWMHRSVGVGSVDDTAAARCIEAGIAVIPGACPMMFCPPVDVVHRCMRFVLGCTGGLPVPPNPAGDQS